MDIQNSPFNQNELRKIPNHERIIEPVSKVIDHIYNKCNLFEATIASYTLRHTLWAIFNEVYGEKFQFESVCNHNSNFNSY